MPTFTSSSPAIAVSVCRMREEIFDVVNERDEVIGQAPRREVHARKLWHRAVHVLVFNLRGEVFLQKRSMQKDTAAGLWDSSSSGHLDSGEGYDACAVRELREEIGLDLSEGRAPRVPKMDNIQRTHGARPSELEKLFKIDACAETGWEFCWVYRCKSDGPFQLHPGEIETGDWFAPEKVSSWVAERPQDFASAFRLVWKRFFTHGPAATGASRAGGRG
jgi:isopentenyl-diphosphate Delta-isomerase